MRSKIENKKRVYMKNNIGALSTQKPQKPTYCFIREKTYQMCFIQIDDNVLKMYFIRNRHTL